jgi:uncharacterized protein YlxW (UPF0749 family)
MSVIGQDDGKVEYTTPHRVQAWFLQRSRSRWKKKYMELKADQKRLQNRVNDVTKSREQWREEAKQTGCRLQEVEAENAALREQLAAFKKDGQCVAQCVAQRGATGTAR